MITPIILAGGSGSRLWPLSRSMFPKQFLCLYGNDTMLQETIYRVETLTSELPLIICNKEYRFIVAEQLRQLNKLTNNIILEPIGKSTAPAIALAALTLFRQNPEIDPILLVLAADHVINDLVIFNSVVNEAKKYAERDKLVTFGIVPNKPETGYGYIRRGDLISKNGDSLSAFNIAEFVEKPEKKVAERYIAHGSYYWNSGIFLFKASTYIKELKKYRPDIYSVCERTINNIKLDDNFIHINEADFSSCPSESIDFAIMEHTDNGVMIPMNSEWSDIGSWSSLWNISEKDIKGNVIHGDVLEINCEDNYIYADSCFVATLGIKDTVVVQTADALLIANKSDLHDLKKITSYLDKNGRSEHISHREIFYPWGKCYLIEKTEHSQIKRFFLKTGEGFSVCFCDRYSSSLTIISSCVQITSDNELIIVSEGESITLISDTIYFLENKGTDTLEFIEIQIKKL